MKKFVALAIPLAALTLTAGASPASKAKPLKVRGGLEHLFTRGDRVMAGYTVYAGSKAVRGTLYVRTDLTRRFTPLALTAKNGYTVRVPNRLIRGHKLFYKAVIRDPKSGRKATLSGSGWILARPVVIDLGTHTFGQTQAPEAVVARARADEVGWDINDVEGFHLGPQTFQLGADGSAWLLDSFNNRLLVWNAGAADHFVRSVPVPYGAGVNDVAFGPAGTLYVTRKLTDPTRLVLDRIDGVTGAILWETQVGRVYGGGPTGDEYPLIGNDEPLRPGPDGTLYYLVQMGHQSGEWGWMPVATPDGKPLSIAAQVKGIHWPYQPLPGGRRLVGPEIYTPHDDMAPHELRYALLDAHGKVVRSWRIVSKTELNFHQNDPQLAGNDPVVFVDFIAAPRTEYVALRLGPHGAKAQLSLPRAVWGDTYLPDLRVGPDGKLYQLSTSPTNGVTISRYSLQS